MDNQELETCIETGNECFLIKSSFTSVMLSSQAPKEEIKPAFAEENVFRKKKHFSYYLGYQNCDARNKTTFFLMKYSCTIIWLLVKTFMKELRLVFFERNELQHERTSKLIVVSGFSSICGSQNAKYIQRKTYFHSGGNKGSRKKLISKNWKKTVIYIFNQYFKQIPKLSTFFCFFGKSIS